MEAEEGMSDQPTERDLQRMMEVLQEFTEAQGGRTVGARPMDDIEDTTVGDDIDLLTFRPSFRLLIPTALIADACPGSGADGHDAARVFDEEVPGCLAGGDDGLVAAPHEPAELVAA